MITEKDTSTMDETTKLLLQIVQDIAELKADMKNIKERLDGNDDKCESCKPSTEVKALKERFDNHLENHKNNTSNKLVIAGIAASFLLGVTTLILQLTNVLK